MRCGVSWAFGPPAIQSRSIKVRRKPRLCDRSWRHDQARAGNARRPESIEIRRLILFTRYGGGRATSHKLRLSARRLPRAAFRTAHAIPIGTVSKLSRAPHHEVALDG